MKFAQNVKFTLTYTGTFSSLGPTTTFIAPLCFYDENTGKVLSFSMGFGQYMSMYHLAEEHSDWGLVKKVSAALTAPHNAKKGMEVGKLLATALSYTPHGRAAKITVYASGAAGVGAGYFLENMAMEIVGRISGWSERGLVYRAPNGIDVFKGPAIIS